MSKPIFCLDAGHYGKYNRSPVNAAYYESDMNWKLHHLIGEELVSYGAGAIYTRKDQNIDLALMQRGMAAEGCTAFISVHSNASANETTDYVAVYCLVDDNTTDIDNISRELAEALAPVIAEVMGTTQGFKVLTRKSDNDRNGDGIMNDNYYGVLNGARLAGVPGLILEHSFHTNLRMTNWLLNDNNLARLAKAEAEVLARYYGLVKGQDMAEDELYRVQVGAFYELENAENMKARLEADGFDTYIVYADGWYKVQVGAYSIKMNAESMLEKLRALGYDSYITTYGGQSVASIVKKSVEEIAREVITGKWGNGTARKTALEAAGYNFAVVQNLVNKLAG